MNMNSQDFPDVYDLAGFEYIGIKELYAIAARTNGKPVILAADKDRFAVFDAATEEPIVMIKNIGERDGS